MDIIISVIPSAWLPTLESIAVISGSLILVLLALFISVSAVVYILFRGCIFASKQKKKQNDKANTVTLGFVHPYCHAGGGGERVLWCAVAALADDAIASSAINRNSSNTTTTTPKNQKQGGNLSSSSTSSTQQTTPRLKIVIYTGDQGVSSHDILTRARDRFGITIPDTLDITFVYLTTRTLLEAWRYPRFTLLGQALGSMVVAIDCLRQYVPDIWIDTTGAAFTFPVARLAGCRIGCYVHYPMVSTDMLAKVAERRPDYNNAGGIASSSTATSVKLYYYKLFAYLYGKVGKLADVVMVNSSWTKAHIDHLWEMRVENTEMDQEQDEEEEEEEKEGNVSTTKKRRNGREPSTSASNSSNKSQKNGSDITVIASIDDTLSSPLSFFTCIFCCGCWNPRRRRRAHRLHHETSSSSSSSSSPSAYIVYPPCNTDAFKQLPIPGRERLIVSVAQFRPEKDHALQLRAFAAFRERNLAAYGDVKLELIGGVRDAGDEARVAALKALARELHLTDDQREVEEDKNEEAADGKEKGKKNKKKTTTTTTTTTKNVFEIRANLPFPQLSAALGRASVTLHTMWNEHFGIGVVESMAAGAVTIAHKSGGPKCDIVVPYKRKGKPDQQTGFLAATPEEYADALETVFANIDSLNVATPITNKKKSSSSSKRATTTTKEEGDGNEDNVVVDLLAITSAARESVNRFSDEEFSNAWRNRLLPLVHQVEREE